MGRSVIGMSAPFMESLESREFFSVGVPQPLAALPNTAPAVVKPASAHVRKTPTLIKFTVTPISTVMGQTIVFTARVRNPNGSPVTGGTVSFIQNTSSVFANATVTHRGYATITIYNAFVGKYSFHCQYDGTRRLLPSVSATSAVTVGQPPFTTLGDGLKIADIVTGSGTATANGNHLVLDYTEYLSDGTFEGSTVGSTPFAATIGGNIIAGFNEGITGMKVGGVRVIVIPPNLGYGNNPPSGIPKNATLVFILKLISFT